VFDLKRNKGTLRYSRELLGNPLLTEKQIVAVQSSEGYKTNYVISCIRNGKVLVKLIKQLDHDDQFENHCNWPFKADLSKSQILEILEVDKRYVVCMPELVNKIAQSKIKACLKPLNDSLRISMCGNSGWPEPILEWLFDWAIALEDAEMSDKALSDIAIHQNVTKTHVKHYLNHKNPEVRMWLAASRVDAVDSLCEREMDNIASLQLLAHDTVHDIRMEAREVLKEWEIDLKPKAEVMKTRKPKSKNTQKKASQKNKRTRAITYLLKSHDAPFGAVKANKKLIELGLIEECERESTTKPGAMRKYKQLTKAGLAYGVNKFNPFGDANIEFYEDDFPELLKKIA